MPHKISIPLSGMHCKACEILNEQNIRTIPGVIDAKLNHHTGLAEIYYEGNTPSRETIRKTLADGYDVCEEGACTTRPNGRKGRTNWQLLIPLMILAYWLISRLNIGDVGGYLSGEFSLPFAALIGLAAGFSTCLALVGGLVFGLAADYAKKNPEATRSQKFKPHIFFNIGRLLGFFVLGGLLGTLGSAFKLSPFFNGILTALIGLVILVLGLKLLGVSPALNRWEFALPKSLGRRIKAENPLLLGALTFFLPCGFTQAMQIYALGSGSFLGGGLIMALFALGTAPGLLSIGGLVAIIKQKQSSLFFKIAGGVLILFAFFNLQNGWNLMRVGANAGNNNSGSDVTIDPGSDFQIIRMVESNRGYTPNRIEIAPNRPVRWIIDAQAPYSCASYLIVPSLGIEKQLKKGENIIEFTPPDSGTIPFSCGMGMYNGAFHIVK